MAYCKYCKVEISDPTNRCPFCQNVLTGKDGNIERYPDIRMKEKTYKLILNLFFFLTICACIIMVAINFLYYQGSYWSILPIGITIYTWFGLKYCIFHNINLGAKVMLELILTQALLIFIDWRTGYSGWSFNYAMPALILIADAAIVILMIANFMNWQSYVLYQLQLLGFSLLPIFLYVKGMITRPIPMMIAAVISIIMLTGTMIFGNKKAKDELLRRFHI